jgi:tetratricopeptide (TPR) repeat protein
MKHFVFILAFLLFFSCKNEKPLKEYLGVVNITITGKEKALPHFEKGLLLLHSFEYEDARESFKEAQKQDASMPMAYWGEAMTYNHSLWQEQDYENAIKALAPLKDINLEKKANELEQDFIKAVQILYESNTEKSTRDIAYSNFMEGLLKKYPSNHEVAAFYALSLLGSVPDGRDDIVYGKGAIIAKSILKENPKHPGALHYLIHSYDDPNHAVMALDAANAYSQVAPDASHALHMPSHIYVALGMWDQVISSNINSYQASLNRMARKKLDNDARGYHAFHWLEYGYLQKENKEEAKKMLLEMQQFTNEKPSKGARMHLVFLKGTYLVDTQEWDSELANIKVDISDLNVSIRSQHYFLEGMKAFSKGNIKQLDSMITLMEKDYSRESFLASSQGASFCSGISRDKATSSDIVKSQIRQNQLLALRASLLANSTLAESYFLKSIELDESISYSYGPPSIQKPTHELYAEWLLSQNRKEEASEQFELALKFAPKRLLALKGIEKTKV